MNEWMKELIIFLEIFYNIIKIAFCLTVYTSTLAIRSFQFSPLLSVFPLLSWTIYSFPLLFCLAQFCTSPLKSMMNINYVLIYRNSTLIAFDFSLTRLYSFLCLVWFPIILCEAKSMSLLFLFYLLTPSLCNCLFFHFTLTILFSLSSNCLWSNPSLYTGSI